MRSSRPRAAVEHGARGLVRLIEAGGVLEALQAAVQLRRNAVADAALPPLLDLVERETGSPG